MDNTTNIIYNIKAIDNATATLNAIHASLQALRKQSNVTIRIKTVYDTRNNITNTVKDVYKASATISATVKRTLVDTYKTVETHQTNVINKNKTINDTLNRTKNVTKDVAKGAKDTSSHFSTWTKNIGRFLSRFINVRRLLNAAVSTLKESAEWTENLHLFEVAFENASEEAYNFGVTLSEAFGTSYNEAVRYLAVFRQMTSAIGIADNTAAKMSKTLTALGYDIASLYNLSIESAMEKLEAGIAGQTKPLRTLGMDITAQSLDNYLSQTLKLGNITSKQMTQADKMILRTIVIMEQAQNAYGDMAETINTFANQVKVLQGSVDNFKLAIGDLIQTYFKPVVSFLAGIIIAITDIIRVFAPLEDTSGIDNLTNSLAGVDEELQDIVETTGLLSFDKFNALTKGNSQGGAGDITSILEGVFSEKYEEYMKSFNEAMKSVKNDANEIALKIKQWVFPFADWDEKTGKLIGELGEVNVVLRLIWTTLKVIVAIAIAKKVTALVPILQNAALQMKLLSMDCRTLGTSVASLKAGIEALSGVWAFVFIYLLIDTLTRLDQLSEKQKIIRGVIIGLVGALWLYSSGMGVAIVQTVKFAFVAIANAIKSLNTLTANILAKHVPALLKFSGTIGGLIVGIAALAAGITYYITSMDKMSTTAKVLIPIIAALSAVFVGLAVAKAAAAAGIAAPVMAGITAAALTAGIVLAAGTAMAVGKYEEGGIPPKGQIFIANENGKPELVGNIGGNNAVANNDMIVAAIENAAFRGFLRAIDTAGEGSSSASNKEIVLVVSGKELARATAVDMANEFGRRNIKIK